MSAVFGLVHFDSKPVASDVAGMAAVLGRWELEGLPIWRDDHAALGLALHIDTPAGGLDPGPYLADHLTFAGAGRLDNRAEIIEALRLGAEGARLSDPQLMFRSYQRWGADCPVHLLGDWSLSVWHPAERRLFLARDQIGNTAVEYFHDRHRFAFAPDRRTLLTLPGVPCRLNELYLAQQLVAWTAFFGPDTAHLGIHRLPPAHALTVTPNGLRTWRYWRLEDAPDVRLPTVRDYADGLCEQMRQAVAARLRTDRPISVTLSAGLDSGAVTALCARELAGTGRTLTAFTAVPRYHTKLPGYITNEFESASATAILAGGIEHIAVSAPDVSPLDGIEWQLAAHGEPGLAPANYYWLASVYKAARGRVLLTGMMGNALFAWSGFDGPAEVMGALRRGAWRRAAATTRGMVARSDDLIAVKSWVRRFERQPWRSYSLIHPQFAARLQLRERMAAAGHNPLYRAPGRTGRATRLDAIAPDREINGAQASQIGFALGPLLRTPLRDARLLTFAHGIPDRYWHGPQARWLQREAMQTLLPASVRLASQRGKQASDLVRRLRACDSRTRALLAEIEDSRQAREIVDLGRMKQLADRINDERYGDDPTPAELFLRGLCAGLFVARMKSD